jgi:hypothetical protein
MEFVNIFVESESINVAYPHMLRDIPTVLYISTMYTVPKISGEGGFSTGTVYTVL